MNIKRGCMFYFCFVFLQFRFIDFEYTISQNGKDSLNIHFSLLKLLKNLLPKFFFSWFKGPQPPGHIFLPLFLFLCLLHCPLSIFSRTSMVKSYVINRAQPRNLNTQILVPALSLPTCRTLGFLSLSFWSVKFR